MRLQQWFSLKGRISRETWWVYYFAIPNGIVLSFGILDALVLPKTSLSQTLGKGLGELSVVSCFGILVGLWLSLAGQVKRWHDQDRTGWLACLTLTPTFVGVWIAFSFGGLFLGGIEFFVIAQFAFLLLGIPVMMFGFDAPDTNYLFTTIIVFVSMLLLFLWVLFLANGSHFTGTPGPNRFGPDPLAPRDAANIALPPAPQ
jgi:uncharacterized membrane protein YhaH (DUF805 family)